MTILINVLTFPKQCSALLSLFIAQNHVVLKYQFNQQSPFIKGLTLPTAVDPVKETPATSGCSHNNLPTFGVFALELVTTLNTPGGTEASSANYKNNIMRIF